MAFPAGGGTSGQKTVVEWLARLDAKDAAIETDKLVQKFRRLDEAGGRITKSTNKLGKAQQRAAQRTKKFKNETKKATTETKKFGRSLNVVRIAAGALIAVGLFRVVNFIETAFLKAVEAAKELETSLFRLSNIERILSKRGVEISLAGLREGIKEIKELLPIFSEEDITKQLSLIGIMTKNLNLTEKQMIDLAKAIGVLNINSADTEDLMSTTNRILQSIVSRGPGVGKLGVKFSETAIRVAALNLGLLKTGEKISDLSDAQRDFVIGQAKVAIAIATPAEELENLNEFMKTNAARIEANEAAWDDLLATAGGFFTGIIPDMIGFIGFIEDAINGFKTLAILAQATENAIRAIFISGLSPAEAFLETLEDGFNKLFLGIIPEDAPDFFKRLFGGFEKNIDTATEKVEELVNKIQSLEDLEGFDKLTKDLEKLSRKLKEVEEDFEIKTTRAFEDFARDRERINIDFDRRRADILRSSDKKIRSIRQKARQRELNDEAKFQEQLRQLREKFLFSLEDALRERDARQVLRLQRQFQMDKQNLINENALRRKERRAEAAQALQDAVNDRNERLRLLEEERQIKLQRQQEDFDLKRARDEEDHQRKLEDIRRQASERLAEFAQAIADEFGLNEEATANLFSLLESFYGSGGGFESLFATSRENAIANAQILVAQMNEVIATAMAMEQALNRSLQERIPRQFRPPPSIGNQAEGGTFLANRPTHAIFGESGPEIASFIPVRKLRTSTAGGMGDQAGGISGDIALRVLLSPDLEGKIVESSMDGVSAVIEKIRREV